MNKQWFRGGSNAEHMPPRRNAMMKEGQELKRAATDLLEAERRIARQIVLISELAERGEAVSEPEKALARLESKMIECRDRHLQLANKPPLDSDLAPQPKTMAEHATAR